MRSESSEMDISPDDKTKAIPALTLEFFANILPEEEPIYVSDEATILDVSMATPEDLIARCSSYYKTAVSHNDLRRPLWQVLLEMDARRREHLTV